MQTSLYAVSSRFSGAATASLHAAEAYRRLETDTRSPLELVVMLYDGALSRLGEASDAATRGDVRSRGTAVSKALAIILSLQDSLNMERGGEVALGLDRLYTYAGQRLLDVGLQQDVAAIDEVRGLLRTVRDAWHQITTTQPAGVP